MYDSRDELLREIQAGEDSYLEFKEVVFRGDQVRFAREQARAPEAVAKTLSCFANTDGGVVVFGVTDSGDIVGVDPAKADLLQRFVVDVAQNNCEPPLYHLILTDKVLLPGADGRERLVLRVEIRKARFNVHAPKGRRPFYRAGSTCLEMTMDHQARLLERRGQILAFEERPCFTAPADVLDRSLFAAYYQHRYGHALEQSEIPYDHLLRNLKLVAEDEARIPHPTTVGLLLFCPSPQDYLGGAFVDLVAYDSSFPDANFQRDAKQITGTVPRQIERCLDYFRSSPFVATAATKDGTGRKNLPMYSLRALQEAVVNAVVHRDYQLTGSQVRIFLFSDRIEISNPGGLHNTIRPEDLYAGCQPYRRNQLLAGFLREYESPVTGRAYMEARGEGFMMLVRESEAVSERRPELRIVGDSVKLIIYAGPGPEAAGP
jgi:ATP-dependent DNA helicase RecG